MNEALIRLALETADQVLSSAVMELWRHRRGPADDQMKDDINDARRLLAAVREEVAP